MVSGCLLCLGDIVRSTTIRTSCNPLNLTQTQILRPYQFTSAYWTFWREMGMLLQSKRAASTTIFCPEWDTQDDAVRLFSFWNETEGDIGKSNSTSWKLKIDHMPSINALCLATFHEVVKNTSSCKWQLLLLKSTLLNQLRAGIVDSKLEKKIEPNPMGLYCWVEPGGGLVLAKQPAQN